MLIRYRIADVEALGTFQGRAAFEQASNALFLPDEFRSINCCVPLPGGGCALWYPTIGYLYFYDWQPGCYCVAPPPIPMSEQIDLLSSSDLSYPGSGSTAYFSVDATEELQEVGGCSGGTIFGSTSLGDSACAEGTLTTGSACPSSSPLLMSYSGGSVNVCYVSVGAAAAALRVIKIGVELIVGAAATVKLVTEVDECLDDMENETGGACHLVIMEISEIASDQGISAADAEEFVNGVQIVLSDGGAGVDQSTIDDAVEEVEDLDGDGVVEDGTGKVRHISREGGTVSADDAWETLQDSLGKEAEMGSGGKEIIYLGDGRVATRYTSSPESGSKETISITGGSKSRKTTKIRFPY